MTDEEANTTAVVCNPEAVSILQGIFKFAGTGADAAARDEGFSKTASVKFMITIQDEKDLRNLGYSQEQIEKMKPEAASEILQAGTKAV